MVLSDTPRGMLWNRYNRLAERFLRASMAALRTKICSSRLLAASAIRQASAPFANSRVEKQTTPRKYGLIASLNRPGSNLAGVTWFNAELGPKRLALLHDQGGRTAIRCSHSRLCSSEGPTP